MDWLKKWNWDWNLERHIYSSINSTLFTVGEGDRGINQGGSETKSDETGGDYGADYDYGK